ncbi:hypothetical protein [Parasedimentitalea psychrophila]|uniref:Uncharacterized protein n=1 Tax=Parasedimentitalea psychrophila TaxID=2997337 RepID=A0A9Y2P6K0_9RHOB|nr:hypothetical protein [Parasedimentitalea psychrophila]WIY25083.1 hypothetical protein QPJ95_21765 [Parasedimentitalea psychrophila]
MNGVVLWSDAGQKRAVIWCEDQGDLAFYAQKTALEVVDLHEGDLVCFDLTLQQNKRKAENPQVLAEMACLGLAQSLIAALPDAVPKPDRTQKTARIIPFAGHLKQKQRENASRRKCVG